VLLRPLAFVCAMGSATEALLLRCHDSCTQAIVDNSMRWRVAQATLHRGQISHDTAFESFCASGPIFRTQSLRYFPIERNRGRLVVAGLWSQISQSPLRFCVKILRQIVPVSAAIAPSCVCCVWTRRLYSPTYSAVSCTTTCRVYEWWVL
jgi:hypothetical protein